jgi:uncharacterized protein HemX
MKRITSVAVGFALMTLSVAAMAQKPIVYPAKGQSASQQSKDDSECAAWAKKETGVDPAKASQPAPPPPPPPAPKGGVVKGAAAGAAVGAIGGNDVGSAAAKGAVIGGVAQHSRKKGQAEAQQAQQQASAQQSQQAMQTYSNAWGACMTGRGYSIK